ncbi:Protein canopy-like protein 4 [Camelus dromedarius]|uniref:Protein canopy-like protein 4 n=3 Tax=Camelus TaxID=9836 RepID=A0A5N4CW24_CAMDR|nr:protein canopy homolog 4 isoform X1 [Camelus ferus]XP_010955316.1 protein canopy homolog 4 isoform X1 [Camelus bactrianus]XP_010996868.1 protein canopy homolog 4 [Camelus dromedarius]KAB1263034.1 Protein canopy-like protein 4 [Camelus dromedarius]KAB1263035.1 Protein canopy-like protein 4 [Camelus dromedarius]
MGPVRLGMLLFILTMYSAWAGMPKEEDDDTERLPSKCEVCKLLSLELQEELSRTGRSREVLELGQVLDTGKRKRHIPYSVSETRLEEALENLCERILDYSVHAERKGSLRYAKGQSQTMAVLKGLVEKGVKVDLGIPLELWDEPSVEVTFLKKQCEMMLEESEDIVEDWYFHHQEQPLQHFLCEGHVLPATETACLQETWTGKENTDGQEKTEGKEDQDQEEVEEEEMTNTPGHPKHDPEDL